MARPTGGRAAAQHEDWLNLTDPEPPWFSLPVVKRAFPQGLDPTSDEVRAEHKIRWSEAEGAPDRADYLDWLLRDALGWGRGYLTGAELPDRLAEGVAGPDTTVAPSGAYLPAAPAPVGFDFEPNSEDPPPPPEPAVLVFALSAGTSPFASPQGDNWSATHVQRAALACRSFGVPLALVTDGDHLTLVHARDKETPTGWGTWRASEFASEPVLLSSFVSMLGTRRFTGAEPGDRPAALLAESVDSQADITDQLGTQVRQAVELLVNAISRANLDRDGTLLEGVGPHEVYEAAVTVMMRLVFLLRAEESGLLPLNDPDYQRLYAIRMLREDLQREQQDTPEALETRSIAWHRLLATARALHSGVQHHRGTHRFKMPAYGGALFDPDRFPFLEGRARGSDWHSDAGTPIQVTDLDVLAILDALLTLRFRSASGVTDTRRLSYKQVEVEQIGHIYERLLDHDVLVADQVVLGCKGKTGDEPEIALSELEARQIDGDEALLDFLTDRMRPGYVGTRNQVRRWLAEPVDRDTRAGLLIACQSDETLVRRIEPFANLLRLDLRGRPIVFLEGAVYVTETGRNRDSGTAYTTRGLAEELVEHALAPLCYRPGPAQTADESQWKIRPSSEILDLKVCDPAVGSGAILVAACRYLGNRLVDAWRAEGDPRTEELATADDDPSRLDVVIEARRLVAERCCYGVDRNPMAAEMAKLSMWLTTVAKDQPFSFLDHAIKCGDSLLGIWDFDQLRNLHFDPAVGRDRTLSFAGFTDGRHAIFRLQDLLEEALNLRSQLQQLPSNSSTDIDRKTELNQRSEQKLAVLEAIADLLSGAALATAEESDPIQRFTEVSDTDLDAIGDLLNAVSTADEASVLARVSERARQRLNAAKPAAAPSRRPMHWPIAFPEVFSNHYQGRSVYKFNAMVANPPFIGGKKISSIVGSDYRSHLVTYIADNTRGSADLVAYFFLSAAKLARSFGYLATNTIAQGDTSEVGLSRLVDTGWTIHRAVSSTSWPGQTALEIAKCWIYDQWHGQTYLDERNVRGIDEMLYLISRSGWRKRQLACNAGQSFQGSVVLGEGFIINPEEAHTLINRDSRNANVLFPFLIGKDLNQSPTQSASRWSINFFDWSEEKSREYPDCFAIVEERVRQQRSVVKRKAYRTIWWRYAEHQSSLYKAIAEQDRVLAISAVSQPLLPAFVPTGQVFSHRLILFAYDDDFHLGVLSSGFHFRWVVRYASSLQTIPCYTPSDVFRTFVQPPYADAIGNTAQALDEFRRQLMVDEQIGLTSLYNRVNDTADHDRSIRQMRALHRDLDHAVQAAYGWDDLDLDHGFHNVRGAGVRYTFAPKTADEILDRLLELNRDRYQAEVAAGLHQNRATTTRTELGGLFAPSEAPPNPTTTNPEPEDLA